MFKTKLKIQSQPKSLFRKQIILHLKELIDKCIERVLITALFFFKLSTAINYKCNTIN